VFLHVAWIAERLVAYFAAEWLEAGMRAHVDFQHVFPAVYFTAVFARKTLVSWGSLGRVCSMMPKEWNHARIGRVAVY